ncbi:MAG: hypothetical protein FJ368_06720 [Pelagibacterales bacterium]|nr:hypothetical protein [Pelagibacterales bacterium]
MPFSNSFAKSQSDLPNITGQVLFELKADRLSTQSQGVKANNAYLNIEPDFSFNLNKNWSIKTGWRLYPTSTVQTRNQNYPERTRTFFSQERGFSPDDTTFIVEELKVDFKADELEFFIGKFNPSFGKAYNKYKRIGVFSTDITEDYELREKIGGGIIASIENSKISVNTFFNDTTGLSGSINGRSVAKKNDGLAGNTGSFNSYTITIDGDHLFGVSNLSYNIGYRSLAVDKDVEERARETGYVFGSQYDYKLGYATTITPFIEFAKISNFTGIQDGDATYATFALIGKYRGWKASVSNIYRRITQYQDVAKINDRQLQYSVGYKLKNGLVLDFSRANIKETPHKGTLYGFMASYLYQF